MAAYHTSNPQKSKMLFASQILESQITLDRLHVLAISSLYFSRYTGGIHVPCLWYKANKTSDGKHVAMSKSNLLVENYNLLSADGQRQQTLDQIFVLANYSIVIPPTLLPSSFLFANWLCLLFSISLFTLFHNNKWNMRKSLFVHQIGGLCGWPP